MSTKSLQPVKGFKDRYPEDKALQDYMFNTIRSVAALYGFQAYDGPLVEPIELYEGKTSRELLEEQAFTLQDRKGNTLMLRPEMTPSMARMVAARVQELAMPVRWFNIGSRYRYEAPQKGRDREFYQMDFDILGSDSILADIEILAVVVEIYKRFGATPDDLIVYINSRSEMNDVMRTLGLDEGVAKKVIAAIDRREKVSPEDFAKMLEEIGLSVAQIESVENFLNNPADYAQRFEAILTLAREYGIAEFIQVNPTIIRGLDYYTGLVFEAKSRRGLGRSLLGGGRYDNLIGMFGTQNAVAGVGFATSDVITREFLLEAGLLPELPVTSSTALVTVFSEELQGKSAAAARMMREAGIATELYPGTVANGSPLQKQLKYAARKEIPFVIVIGPDEAAQDVVMLKDMTAGTQEAATLEQVVTKLSSYARK